MMKNAKENAANEEKRKLLLAQDMKFVKALAGNEKKIRDRALKNLREWLPKRSSQLSFTEDDFLRIWKGLFTTMWMSDKPLSQEECAEAISTLIHEVEPDSALLFFKCGLRTMAIEWFGIDQWRLDKFLMLVRRMLRQCFEFLKSANWRNVAEFSNTLTETLMNRANANYLGLTMHVTEIFLEELAKVSNGKVTQSVLFEFLRPFVKQLMSLDDNRQIRHLTRCIFHHLMQQSDEGLEYEAKFSAWKRQGFPGGSLDVMERVEVDSDEESEEENGPEALDPRAGHVDVVLPQLKFNPLKLCDLLCEFKFDRQSTTNGRKAVARLHHEFSQLAEGVYPLGMTKVPLPKKTDFIKIHKSLENLNDFEHQLRIEKRNLKRTRVPNGKLNGDIDNVEQKRAKRATNFETKLNGGLDLFTNKLKQFVRRSEGKIKKPKLQKTRKRLKDDLNWSFEDSFVRNSGIWDVHKFNTTMTESQVSPSPVRRGSSTLFAESEWKEPTKEETEIITASPKSVLKGKQLRKLLSKAQSPAIANLVKVTPKNGKKVRIALKLNQSQEVHEHVAQLKSSPGIPYDANRMPEKPLLKPNAVKSPINPFYKRKLKL